jgi:hypothetical protein
VRGLAFSPAGSRAVSAGQGKDVHVWEGATFEWLCEEKRSVAHMAFHPSESLLAIAERGSIELVRFSQK